MSFSDYKVIYILYYTQKYSSHFKKNLDFSDSKFHVTLVTRKRYIWLLSTDNAYKNRTIMTLFFTPQMQRKHNNVLKVSTNMVVGTKF